MACATSLAGLGFAFAAFADPTGAAWTKDAMGATAIFKLATAPFPHPSRSYTDNRVMFFVPAGFRPGSTVDLVIHYHGHRNEIVNSDKGHRYREQHFLSRKNAVLIQPQGPLNASDSGGGKHEDPDGLKHFVDEVLTVLARENVVATGTKLGQLALSGHSGAYHVIAKDLAVGGVAVNEVYLHDALYGDSATFEAWAKKPGSRFISTTTRNGGTWANNDALRGRLQAAGVAIGTNEEHATLAGYRTIFVRTDVAHDASTYQRLRWAKLLEYGSLSDLGVARPRLRAVRGAGAGTIEVSWYPSRSSLVRGYRLYEGASASGPFTLVQDEHVLGASATSARLQTAGDKVYRVAAVDDRGRESDRSNVYASTPDGEARARVLVVDGFVRTSGAWKSYEHGFAALVAQSARTAGRAVDTCRANAVTDGSVKLSDYATVVWLAGDQSLEDAALTTDERKVLSAALARGTTVLMSGSELGYALGGGSASPDEKSFFNGSLHAVYAADSDPGRTLSNVGTSLNNLSVSFGGSTAPYAVRFPDVLAAGSAASVALKYPDGRGAAVAYEGLVGGTSKSGVLTVGLPLECLDGAVNRDALLGRALEWLDGVNRRAGR